MHAPFTPSGVEQVSWTFLHDYTHVQLPDLSNKRIHTVVELQKHEVALDEDLLHAYPDNLILDALILVAYTHVLGLYCGVTDVLICLDTSNDTVSPFRLQWNEHTTWSTAIEAARIAIHQSRNHQIPLVVLQQALGLQPDQCPFVAFFRPSGAIDHTSHLTHPLLLHAEDGLLSLQSSSLWFSPSVSSMLLRQIVTLATDTLGDSERKLTTPSRFSDDLAAVVKALPADERSSYYSHIALVCIATDYLLPYVNSTPDATAVQWYPVLSPSTGTAIASESLSYNDLHRSANQFARFLVGRGLCPGDRVAACMDRNPVFHTVMFGILRAGGCYVPVSAGRSNLRNFSCSLPFSLDRPRTSNGKENLHSQRLWCQVRRNFIADPAACSFRRTINGRCRRVHRECHHQYGRRERELSPSRKSSLHAIHFGYCSPLRCVPGKDFHESLQAPLEIPRDVF
jgi:hypothetical protein